MTFLSRFKPFWVIALLLGILPLLTHNVTTTTVQADTNTSDWQEPVITLGSSLTTSQKEGTLAVLTQALSNSGESYKTITVTGSTLVRYLNPAGATFSSSSGVWSSAAIEKTASGSGINVKILPYQGQSTITTITANQYKNAAVTAGISDANIYVTSATPIDGSGALAGVYAAFAAQGDALNSKQVTAAQQEMSTLSDISQQNKDKSGYSDAQLNNAIAQAKKAMADKGSTVTNTQIGQIVNQQLINNGLQNIITGNQRQNIINVLIKVRDSGALNSNEFKKQASQLANQIQNKAKKIFAGLNTKENQNFFSQIGSFISGIIATIASWFH